MTDTGGFIAAGGFGCVAKPGFECADPKNEARPAISKLMITKEAEREWDKIQHYRDAISKIPNNELYFLLGQTTLCNQPIMYTGYPDQPNDFNNLDKLCSPITSFHQPMDAAVQRVIRYNPGIDVDTIVERLRKKYPKHVHDINAKEVQDSKNRLAGKSRIKRNIALYSNVLVKNVLVNGTTQGNNKMSYASIQMPYGGNEVGKYLKGKNITKDELMRLNEAIIALINNGIYPMNRPPVDIIHNDVKLANVLYDEKTGNAKLIDFGVATKIKRFYKFDRSNFYVHHPYISILFLSEFVEPTDDVPVPDIQSFIEKNNRELIQQRVNDWNKQANKEGNVYLDLSFDKLSEQLAIIFTEIININASKKLYYTDIYSKNADIYGLIIRYLTNLKRIKKRGGLGFVSDTVLEDLFQKFIMGNEYLTQPYDKESIETELRKIVTSTPIFNVKQNGQQFCTKAMAAAGLCAMGLAAAAPYLMGGKKTKKRKSKSKSLGLDKKNTRRNHKKRKSKSRRKSKKN